MATQYVYDFSDGGGLGRELLGGKGVGLAEMTAIGIPGARRLHGDDRGLPRVHAPRRRAPGGARRTRSPRRWRGSRSATGKRFGDPDDPLLVSVRSGAAVSMPGMMDTILNLGLNDDAVEGLARATGNERFAFDAYRRLIQMFGDVVAGVDGHLFEQELGRPQGTSAASWRTSISTAADLRELVGRFQGIYAEHGRDEFPQDRARPARARGARRLRLVGDAARAGLPARERDPGRPRHGRERRPDGLREQGRRLRHRRRASRATRRPASPGIWGEFLVNAQGEDVVAGIRTPEPIAGMKERFPRRSTQLAETMARLEEHYREMQDIEFTVEEGALYLLQTRTGKRTAAAALRIAVEMVGEGLLTQEEAVARIDPAQLDQLLHPRIDPRPSTTSPRRG